MLFPPESILSRVDRHKLIDLKIPGLIQTAPDLLQSTHSTLAGDQQHSPRGIKMADLARSTTA